MRERLARNFSNWTAAIEKRQAAAAAAAAGVVVVVVMTVATAAAASAAMVVVIVRVGIDQRDGESALEGERHFARRVRRLHGQRHDLGGETDVVDGAEVVAAQAALAVVDQHRRRPLQLVGRERCGQAAAVRLVVGDGEREAVLLDEVLERVGRLLVVVLEHGMKADHRHLVVVEGLRDARRLRQAVLHGGRARHLEHGDHRYFAPGLGQELRALGVVPALDAELGRAFGIEHAGAVLSPYPGPAECRSEILIARVRMPACGARVASPAGCATILSRSRATTA